VVGRGELISERPISLGGEREEKVRLFSTSIFSEKRAREGGKRKRPRKRRGRRGRDILSLSKEMKGKERKKPGRRR